MRYIVTAEKLKIDGPEPAPRAFQTAIFYKKYIAVFGGRNDQDIKTGDFCLNDIALLDLSLLKWQSIVVYGFIPSRRWGHTMSKDGNSLIVFGGVSETRLASSTVYTLELDEKMVEENLNECRRIKYTLEFEAKRTKIL